MKFRSVIGQKWRVSGFAISTKIEIDNCTITFPMLVAALLSTDTIGLPGQAWPSLAKAHLNEFTQFFTQMHLSHRRISVLDPVYPTCAFSSAHTVV